MHLGVCVAVGVGDTPPDLSDLFLKRRRCLLEDNFWRLYRIDWELEESMNTDVK